jgi:hypothetical protein
MLRYAAKHLALDHARLQQMREASQRQRRIDYRRAGILVGLSFKIAWRLRRIGHYRLENCDCGVESESGWTHGQSAPGAPTTSGPMIGETRITNSRVGRGSRP